MLVLPISPLEANAVLWWARLDRLTSREPDEALQQLAGRVRDAMLAEVVAGGLAIDVAEVLEGMPGVEKEAASKTPSARPTCITPACGRVAESRGLCSACYQKVHKLVTKGTTTWEELEQARRVLPKGER